MKQIIRKILKEDKKEKYYQRVIDYIEKNNIWTPATIFEIFGLGEEDVEYFQGKALDRLNDLEGMSFDSNDYKSLSFGSYEFEFEIKKMVDFESFYYGVREIEIEVVVTSGIVDIEGETIDVMTAAKDKFHGWEVQLEMQDCVADIIRYLIPEIVPGKVGLDVSLTA